MHAEMHHIINNNYLSPFYSTAWDWDMHLSVSQCVWYRSYSRNLFSFNFH